MNIIKRITFLHRATLAAVLFTTIAFVCTGALYINETNKSKELEMQLIGVCGGDDYMAF